VLRRVAENSGWLVGEKAVRLATGLVVTVWIARHLGPADYGILMSTLAFVLLFGPLANLGLEAIAVREIARRPADAAAILGTAFVLRLGAGLAGAAAAWLAGAALGLADSAPPLVLAVLSATLLFQCVDVVDCWFQANLRSRLTVSARLTAFGLAVALRVGLLFGEQPLEAFALAVLAEYALAACGLAAAYFGNAGAGRWHFDRALAATLARDSWPLMLSASAAMLYSRFDQVLLRALSGPQAAGALAAILPFSEGWYILATALSTSLTPLMSRLYEQSPERFYARLQQLFRGAVLAGIAVAAATSLGAAPLVALVLGPAYEASGPVLAVHVWTVVFVFMGMVENQWMIAANATRIRLAKTLLGAAVGVALNLALVPRLGALGAAAAAVATQAAILYFANFFLARRIFMLQTRAVLPLWPAAGAAR
jgi:PST family polysaccharide transporter